MYSDIREAVNPSYVFKINNPFELNNANPSPIINYFGERNKDRYEPYNL